MGLERRPGNQQVGGEKEKNLRSTWPENPGGSVGQAQEKGSNSHVQSLGSCHLLALLVKFLLKASWRETEPGCHTVIQREPLPRITKDLSQVCIFRY